jgi:uncharacterized membrane protein
MKASDFLTEAEKAEILEAIKTAEHDTSGEIRVHLEMSCKGDVLDRSAEIFSKLGMHKTELRNGVLIYLAIEDRKFSIIGDSGINKLVAPNFWENVKVVMRNLFEEGKFAEGLIRGIIMAGENLKANFPFQYGDVNELSDEISFGKE